ncbi:hypothetical protein NC653_006288 [Populus alba x Populus x berolinensis]|uniref:Uncharacterized protein n=1 Tax=Populus alba x Populus x berolinensis TaxID=444605 RepID=A0AAD6REB5_9ROSI|nr:hypothetical protein NC653_006288 [Populus alba x Populus x berolinensis]
MFKRAKRNKSRRLKQKPSGNSKLLTLNVKDLLQSAIELHNLPNNNLHPQVFPIVLFMFTRT